MGIDLFKRKLKIIGVEEVLRLSKAEAEFPLHHRNSFDRGLSVGVKRLLVGN